MGVPAVLWPHFLDQHHNAKCLRESGAGLNLFEKQRYTNNVNELVSYRTPMFDRRKVRETFEELLSNSKYKVAMLKLQMQSRLTGGRDLAVRTIENHYVSGCEHLVDYELIRKYDSMSCCKSSWSILIGLGILITLAYYTT